MRCNKIISAFLSLFTAAASLSFIQDSRTVKSYADDRPISKFVQGYFIYSIYEDHAILNSCKTTVSGKLVIASTALNTPVTEIKDEAFKDCNELRSIDIGKNITSIGEKAFSGCTSLKSVRILNPNCHIPDTSLALGDPSSTVIYGRMNSTAQSFADKYGYKFYSTSGNDCGDTNNDGKVDAVDASVVLAAYSKYSTVDVSPARELMMVYDVNDDGKIDSNDASKILAYYVYASGEGDKEDFAYYINYKMRNK